MTGARIPYGDDTVGDRVRAVRCTSIDGVDVVDAAADGVLFDDADTHDDVGELSVRPA